MKNSIFTLMDASGHSTLAKEVSSCITLYDMLHSYRTGTQKRKEWNRVHKPPKVEEIGCIENIIFDSPEHKAKVLFNRSLPKISLDPTDEVEQFVPDYVKTGYLLNAANVFPSRYDYVGFELFCLRRNIQPCERDYDAGKIDTARKQWQILSVESEERSIRHNTKPLANLKSPKKHPVTSSTRKRKAPDVRITRAMKKKKTRQGPSGHSSSNVCAKCGVTSDITWMSFHRIPPYPAELPHNPSKNRVLAHRGKR